MNEGVVLLLMFVGFILLVGLTTGWALSMQRKSLKKQSVAISAVDESLSLTRESMVLARRNSVMLARPVALAEASAAQQAEMVRLLNLLAARQDGGGGAEPGS